ncbi:hypothetical protein ACSQ67_020003 [Phaseolus vulgaris]
MKVASKTLIYSLATRDSEAISYSRLRPNDSAAGKSFRRRWFNSDLDRVPFIEVLFLFYLLYAIHLFISPLFSLRVSWHRRFL